MLNRSQSSKALTSWFACTLCLPSQTHFNDACGVLQLVWLCMLEVPAYALSTYLVGKVGGIDAGGSITIHAFGAYYGLAASYFFSFPASGSGNPKNGASYTSDVFAMLASM